MEVTKSNFYEQFDSIVQSINSCDFMAIDGEFTGLDVEGCENAAPFDTPEERYQKVRYGSTDFLLVQFGLCTFHANKEKQRYEARPYNFYVFPRPHSRQAPDRRFLCQSSSIEFLTSHGFDFNKLFKEGIPYLMPHVEEKLRSELALRQEDATNKVSSPSVTAKMNVPKEQKPFLNSVLDKISNYLDSEEKEPLAIPPCNSYQRRLLYQTIEEKFPNVFLETVTGEKKERYMLVSKINDTEERLKKEKEKQAKHRLEIDLQVGFSKVIQEISQSGKLVVGHNMFLDVIHSVNQFHSPLPSDLDGFKAMVKAVFPRLLDTKLMASTHPFKEYILSTSLDEVRLAVNTSPFLKLNIDLAEGYESYNDSGALHEAGYDAYVTGCCFARMTRFLGTFQDPIDDFLLPTSPAIEPFVNKLFLMRINDIPFMNMSGPDLPANRDHVFHVTFPEEWKASDLFTLFYPYGTIQFSWLSSTSAYVGLHKRENAKKALKALSKDTSNYRVVSYAFHQKSKSFKSQDSNKRKAALQTPECTPSKAAKLSNSELSPNILNQTSEIELPDKKSSSEVSDSLSDDNGLSTKQSKDTEQNDKLFEEADAW